MNSAEHYVKQFIENILAFYGINLEVEVVTGDDIVNASVPSSEHNGFLIGERGANLRALQYLVRSALINQEFEVSRVTIDIADYKKQRNERLAEQVRGWIDQVKTSGTQLDLEPMNPADRRIVHQTVADDPGVTSESAGHGRDRHVVISLAN